MSLMDFFHVYDRHIYHDEMDYYGHYPPAQYIRLTGNAFFCSLAPQGFALNDLVSKINATWMLGMADLHILKDFGSDAPKTPVRLYALPLMHTGAVFLSRIYAVVDDEPIAMLDGLGMVVSLEKRKLIRPAEVASLLGQDICEAQIPAPARIKLPEDMTFVQEFPVYYAFCDVNRHLTFSRYADLICESIEYWSRGHHRAMKRLRIEYDQEARIGDVLSIYIKEIDGQIYVKGLKQSGVVSFKAIVEMVDE